VIDLRAVSKFYGTGPSRVDALVEVDLHVPPGSLVAVMGPSGSGKSTLLTIAGAMEEPSSGQVLLGGRDLASSSPEDRAALRRRTIGYVFQDFNLLAGLTALENVTLPLELDGTSPKRARPAGLAALDRLGVLDKADRFPDDRHILLADEPTGALDSVNGEAVMRLLRAACREGVTGIVVTHDAQLAAWADRIVFLRDGRLVDQTAPPSGPESLLVRDVR
jgi:putative ABC transport system ATP-binding protein